MRKNFIAIHLLTLLFIITVLLLPTRFTFLAWNIVLAIIPFDIALIIKHLAPTYKWLSITFVLVWLIFYPNTIYMITDFAHLSAIGTGLITSHQILNYGLLATGIFLGVTLGITSARIVIQALLSTRSNATKLMLLIIISVLSSYAIYVGRFLRLNSWDLILDFNTVFVQMHDALSLHAMHFVLVFTFVQIFLMLTYVVLNPKNTDVL